MSPLAWSVTVDIRRIPNYDLIICRSPFTTPPSGLDWDSRNHFFRAEINIPPCISIIVCMSTRSLIPITWHKCLKWLVSCTSPYRWTLNSSFGCKCYVWRFESFHFTKCEVVEGFQNNSKISTLEVTWKDTSCWSSFIFTNRVFKRISTVPYSNSIGTQSFWTTVLSVKDHNCLDISDVEHVTHPIVV